MEYVVVNCLTDEKRKQDLLGSHHMEVRVGDSFGMNCLADSLLQCLVFHNMIETSKEETSEVQWRRRLCASARDHLCRYADEWLRPRQRDEHNAIRCVAQDEHENTFLEHHRHAEALVMYFLDYYGKSGVDRSRGVRVIVFFTFR